MREHMYKNTPQFKANWNFDKNYAFKYKRTKLS